MRAGSPSDNPVQIGLFSQAVQFSSIPFPCIQTRPD
jgi:hypothetical protein